MHRKNLKILQYRKKVFCRDIDITENDLYVKVWGPLLECIMRDEQDLRLKWGDSMGYSAEVADGHDAFKVDVRVVRDIFSARQSKKESDTGNVELSRKGASISKITDDKFKLLIESKCVLDRIMTTLDAQKAVVVPALQLKGLKAELSSLQLAADSLYIYH
ncbi:predicted protein [Lichtheimia corymbifera JMRC:FSU:9682]|uniref:Uncharacterized protein n=1 Tax=Lichtheimia corymbifera JMRC:FSU:9682 TaxID=1263082 RepID=A0A068RKV2_9FUNG|nr:predicted protein [Lichtheimia corymbifera JMRC:FSU:9682]